MPRRLNAVCAAAITVFVLILGGCALFPSPAVGKWTGTMKSSPQSGLIGAFITGAASTTIGDAPANLELRTDGTGYLKLPMAPDRQITWKADGDKVLLYGATAAGGNTPSTGVLAGGASTNTNTTSSDGAVIGTLSDDKKTLTFDLGPIEFALTRQAN